MRKSPSLPRPSALSHVDLVYNHRHRDRIVHYRADFRERREAGTAVRDDLELDVLRADVGWSGGDG